MWIIVLIFMIIVAIVMYSSENNKNSEKFKEDHEEDRAIKEKLEQFRINNKISENQVIWYKYGYPLITKNGFNAFVWRDENNLFFYDKGLRNNIGEIAIPIKNIEYFSFRGEVGSETKTTGGGISGGGSSVKGAVVGGILAGGAGAIIGSRKPIKSEPVKSETKIKDNRETFLNFFIDGKKHSMLFNYKGYLLLQTIIPEKDYNKNQNSIANYSNSKSDDDIIKKIKQLSELKDEGILTEEEFQEKKKELLEKM